MSLLIAIVSIFLALGTIKLVLFWIYLWQLKEYHIGRFIDHFRTHKGKRIIFSYFTQFLFWRIKKPVFTAKAILLAGLTVALTLMYFWLFRNNLLLLAIFNLLTPIIVSAIVLVIQPLFVMARKKILQQATEKVKKFPHLKVIAITGSYGKTSTKEFLTTILSEKFKVLSTPEHKNSEMGIAQTILSKEFDELVKDETRAPLGEGARPSTINSAPVFIVEMGSYNKGGIKLLCDMVQPQIGMVTGVNHQHLATFGSLENLLSAEGGQELLAALPAHGLLVVNGDNEHCIQLYKSANIRKHMYALKNEVLNADIWTEDVVARKDGISFIARTKSKEMAHFDVKVLGKQHVQNMLGAILVAHDLGMNFGEILEASKKIQQKQGGMTLKKGVYGITVIDSSYSSNPDGVIADLDYLNIFPGKKVIAMPCLIELGSESTKIHINLGEKIAKVCDLLIITTQDKFKEIKMGAVAAGMKEENILLCDNAKEAFYQITGFCQEGDTVLLEGRVPHELMKLLHVK